MSSMTGNLSVAPQPDLYYGTRVGDIAKPIRDDIGRFIIPATVPNAPAAPHFVLETKGPAGNVEVVRRQAAHSTAATARAAVALENFRVDNPEYDNTAKAHAWTFSSESGDLTQYAMRVSRPEPGSSEPSYHFAHVKTHHIIESVDQFRRGVLAFRYYRDASHAKNQARLAQAHERLRCRSEQTSHPAHPASTLPPCLPESEPGMTTDEYFALMDRQLQQDCDASFSDTLDSSLAAVTTSMTSVSTHVTASPHDDASSPRPASRPQRTRRRPERYKMLDSDP
ncbi:hypothetical protein GJ744_001491 [Endocarpon pusillum]|uniref:Uncharacterized protein n=1 Tax=Endocarpon pusillum TaxID=364733 RepID=A0A8H7AC88_9EURO|nr:hypothetical protein GJ744_001491 [Endocarpon pusillum]